MSDTIKVIHTCNHVIPTTEILTERNTFVKSANDFDKVTDNVIHTLDDVEVFKGLKGRPGAPIVFPKTRYSGYAWLNPSLSEIRYSKTEGELVGTIPDRRGAFFLPDDAIDGPVSFVAEGELLFNMIPTENTSGEFLWSYGGVDSFNFYEGFTITGDGSSAAIGIRMVVDGMERGATDLLISATIRTTGACQSVRAYIKNHLGGSEKGSVTLVTSPVDGKHYTCVKKMVITAPVTDEDSIYFEAIYATAGAANGNKITLVNPREIFAEQQGTILIANITNHTHYLAMTEEELSDMISSVDDYSWPLNAPVVFSALTRNLMPGTNTFINANMTPDGRITDDDGGSNSVSQLFNVEPLATFSCTVVPGRAATYYYYDGQRAYLSSTSGNVSVAPEGAKYGRLVYAGGDHTALNTMVQAGTLSVSKGNTPIYDRDPVTGTALDMFYIDERLSRLPNGTCDTADLKAMIVEKKVGYGFLADSQIIALDTGNVNVDIIVIETLLNQKFTDVPGVKGMTRIPYFPEMEFADSTANEWTHFLDHTTQQIKIVKPKGSHPNLTDAKMSMSGTEVFYELEIPTYRTTYKRFYSDTDFSRFGQNMIKWHIGAPDEDSPISEYLFNRTPRAGEECTISLETKKVYNRSYEEAACPRCNGNGWYVSAIEEGSGAIAPVTGIEKTVQDFLKILLTDVRYYQPGTAFLTLRGMIKREEKTEALIEMYVRDAEMQLKQIQYELSIAGSAIDKYEELKTVIIKNIDTTSDKDKVYIELHIINMAFEDISVSLEI